MLFFPLVHLRAVKSLGRVELLPRSPHHCIFNGLGSLWATINN